MKRTALLLGAFAAVGWILAVGAADIAFRWDSSGRAEVVPAVAAANVPSFDSVVRHTAESSRAEDIRAAYRSIGESAETAVLTFQSATLLIVR